MYPHTKRKAPIFMGDVVKFDVSTYKHPDTWALVDASDWETIKGERWSATKRANGLYVKNHRLGLLHRHLLKAPQGRVVDHRDGNPLNNCRENIRVCTQALNNQARFDRERGYALIRESVEVQTKDHVVKVRLASGEIGEYRYPTRSPTGTKRVVFRKILPPR